MTDPLCCPDPKHVSTVIHLVQSHRVQVSHFGYTLVSLLSSDQAPHLTFRQERMPDIFSEIKALASEHGKNLTKSIET